MLSSVLIFASAEIILLRPYTASQSTNSARFFINTVRYQANFVICLQVKKRSRFIFTAGRQKFPAHVFVWESSKKKAQSVTDSSVDDWLLSLPPAARLLKKRYNFKDSI